MNSRTQKALSYYESRLGPSFTRVLDVEVPSLVAQFVMEKMVDLLTSIQIDSPQINFLLFYPFMRNDLAATLKHTPQELASCTQADETRLQCIFYNISRSFTQLWEVCGTRIRQILSRFQKLNLKSNFLNRIVILTLIKQLSTSCENKVTQKIRQSSFRLIPKARELNKYILERFDVFEFKTITESDFDCFGKYLSLHYSSKEAKIKVEIIFNKQYSFLKKEPCVKNGRQGILVSDPQQIVPAQSQAAAQPPVAYMLSNSQLHDEVIITNSRYLNEGWAKCSPDLMLQLDQKELQIDFKLSFQTSSSNFVTSAVTNVGSSLGYLIANMPNNPTKFLKDFLVACTISGSMSAIIQEIPLLGQLIVLGGLGYQTLNILSNADVATKKKIQKILGITLSMGVTITSSVYGAIMGQALIPVPILGGFIGGMIGGMVAGISTSAALSKFQQSKIKSMTATISNKQKEDGSWETSVVLEVLHVKISFFQKHEEPGISTSDLVTMFCYYFLTVFQTQKDQLQINQLNDSLKDKWYKKNLSPEEKQAIEVSIQQISENIPDSILKAEVYLLINKLSLVDHMIVLEKLIEQFLDVI